MEEKSGQAENAQEAVQNEAAKNLVNAVLQTAADAGGVKDLVEEGPSAPEKAAKEAANFINTA